MLESVLIKLQTIGNSYIYKMFLLSIFKLLLKVERRKKLVMEKLGFILTKSGVITE